MNRPGSFAPLAALSLLLGGSGATAGERFAIEPNQAGVERIEVVDVNGDGRADVVAVGRGVCSWYENPAWTRHLITGVAPIPGLCTSATADLDGDGRGEVVLGSAADPAAKAPGKLWLAARKPGGEGWEVAEAGAVPDLGRLIYWCERLDATGRVRLVLSPPTGTVQQPWEPWPTPTFLVMPASGAARLRGVSFLPYVRPPKDQPSEARTTGALTGVGVDGRGRGFPGVDPSLPPLLGRWVRHLWTDEWMISPQAARYGDAMPISGWPTPDAGLRLLAVTDQAVTLSPLREFRDHREPRRAGDDQGFTPRLVEVIPARPGHAIESARAGRSGDGRAWIAVVERVEGRRGVSLVDVTPERPMAEPRERPGRVALEASPEDPRALWVGDLDGDGRDEVVAGDVGPGGRRLIRFDHQGAEWRAAVLDPDLDARELRGGDLDGDGRPDLVAVDAAGRITAYRSRPPAGGR